MPRRTSTTQTTESNALDTRAQAVLAAVIKEHLVTGDAVGSLVLADRFAGRSGWSSATIRNVMGELEAAGFVSQLKLPHYVDFQSELELIRKLRQPAEGPSHE